ncbi:cell envelope integrity protein TolA [Piscinibacter sakaiensis]|uniref:cell envelope integrity protein TolA n=1 Tax=Piscinibacter sakaiensis TaxID=1547922 RepID=UPI003AB0C8F9
MSRRDPLAPRNPDGMGRGFVLAVLAHALLVIALAIGVNWRASNPEGLQAELWAAVPQVAAPRAAAPEAPPPKPEPEPEPPPKPPAKKAPPPPPAPEPEPAPPPKKALPDPQIAIEKARREERERKLEEEREQEKKRKEEEAKKLAAKKLELEKVAREKAAREKAEAEKLAKAKAEEEKKLAREKAEAEKQAALEKEKKRKEEELRQAKLAEEKEKAEAKRIAEQREQALKRMLSQAGGATGEVGSKGTEAQNAAPSDSYAGRVKARIKPNIVFVDELTDNPQAEVLVRLAPDGRIISQRLVRSSGSKDWDAAVQRAIERTEMLPRDVDGRVPSTMLIAFRPRE